MADVFLSYAEEDAKHARSLATALEAEGWSVWWDHRILPGQSWSDVIEQQLSAARCVVVMWSTHSVRSQWVKNEARRGLERHMLVPVTADRNITFPLEFSHVQAAYLPGWTIDVEDSQYVNLIGSIRSIVRRDRRSPHPLTSTPERRPRWMDVVGAAVLASLVLVILVKLLSAVPRRQPMTAAPPPAVPSAAGWDPSTAVGILVGSGRDCSAVLVGRDLALTHSDCVAFMVGPVSVRFGSGTNVKLHPATLLERDFRYALLRLTMPVDAIGQPASLHSRLPRAGETVRVLSQPVSGPVRVAVCDVQTVAVFTYGCSVEQPAKGSPIFGEDGALLGIHHGKSLWKTEGIKLSTILGMSAAL